jgi:putative sterol carrier protein
LHTHAGLVDAADAAVIQRRADARVKITSKQDTPRRVGGVLEAGEEFFQELGRRGHEPLLAKVTGSVRFDLVDDGRTDRWLVAVDQGGTTVSHGGGAADCTIRADRALFERLCRGEENAIAAVLRGALVCTGDVELLFAIQRIFPGPPRDRHAVSGSEGSR